MYKPLCDLLSVLFLLSGNVGVFVFTYWERFISNEIVSSVMLGLLEIVPMAVT